MPKYIELLSCDWLISDLCYQAIEQVSLIKWPGECIFKLQVKYLTPEASTNDEWSSELKDEIKKWL